MKPPLKASGFVSPPPRKRPEPPVVAPPLTPPAEAQVTNEASTASILAPTSNHLRRSQSDQRTLRVKKEKRTGGDYRVGYCRAPQEHQFKPGNKGGPGRPRGSKSQNSLLRAELERKLTTREGGITKKFAARDLLSRLVVTGPINSRNYKDIVRLNALARDLYPDPVSEIGVGVAEAYDPAKDETVLRNFLALLQLGEASPDNVDPFTDRATGQPDPGQLEDDDGWEEGNWDEKPEEASDENR